MIFKRKDINNVLVNNPQSDLEVSATLDAYVLQKHDVRKLRNRSTSQIYASIVLPHTLNTRQICALSSLLQEEPGVYFLNKAIQESYCAGYNDFIIPTVNATPNYFCSHLKGEIARPMIITVVGNTGDYLGTRSKHLHMTITGNTGNHLGSGSKYLIAMVDGNNGNELGYNSTSCTVTIRGNNGNFLGRESRYLNAVIHGNNGNAAGFKSNDLHVIIHKNNGHYLGGSSTKLFAEVMGNNGDFLGFGSIDLTAKISGNTGERLGLSSENLTATIIGHTGEVLLSDALYMRNANITLADIRTVENYCQKPYAFFYTKLLATYDKLSLAGLIVELLP